MAKIKANALAITQAASLAARRLAALEKEAAAVHASETERTRGLQLVSSKDGLSALIRHGKVVIQIEGDSFAVTSTD